MKINKHKWRNLAFEAQCTKSLLLLVRHSHAVKQAQLSKSFKYCRGDER